MRINCHSCSARFQHYMGNVSAAANTVAHSLLQIKTQSPNRSTGREAGSSRIYEKMNGDWM